MGPAATLLAIVAVLALAAGARALLVRPGMRGG
jgi:hypothetical protein